MVSSPPRAERHHRPGRRTNGIDRGQRDRFCRHLRDAARRDFEESRHSDFVNTVNSWSTPAHQLPDAQCGECDELEGAKISGMTHHRQPVKKRSAAISAPSVMMTTATYRNIG
jgi:hypothetical protein